MNMAALAKAAGLVRIEAKWRRAASLNRRRRLKMQSFASPLPDSADQNYAKWSVEFEPIGE
jgi:hypothetical protein